MAGDRIDLDKGTTSELALALRDAIARNLEREEGRRAREGLGGRVLIRAEDTEFGTLSGWSCWTSEVRAGYSAFHCGIPPRRRSTGGHF